MATNKTISLANGVLTCDGRPIQLKGANLGSWLNIEDFMIGLSGTDWRLRASFREVLGEETAGAFFLCYADAFITEADIRFVRDAGMNLLRLPFNYRYFESDEAPFEYFEDTFQRIDQLMDWCEQYGIYVLLDYHAAQGGQNNTPPADQTTVYPHLWYDRLCQDRFIALWKELASRYKNRSCLLGYDLVNEPITTVPGPKSAEEQCSAMNSLFHSVIRAIRSVDPEHLIIVEGNVRTSGGIVTADRALFEYPNVMGSFHYYPIARWEKLPGMDFSSVEAFARCRSGLRAAIEKGMDMERRFAEANRVPLLLGECGIVTAPGRIDDSIQSEILDTQLSVAESWGFHWTIWSLKDIGKMGLLRPTAQTPWRRFVENGERERKSHEARQAFAAHFSEVHVSAFGKTEENRRTFDLAHSMMSDGIKLMHLRRTLEDLAVFPADEITRMPESFRFENCEPANAIARAIAPHLSGTIALPG